MGAIKSNLPAKKTSGDVDKARPDKFDIKPYINHSFTLNELRPLSDEEKRDPRMVEDRCQEYFRICAEQNVKPTVIGLAVAFRVHRNTLLRARSDRWGAESAAVINHYANLIDLNTVNLTLDGKIYANYAEFLQKNTAGYTDKTEVTVEKGDSLLTKDDLISRAEALNVAEHTDPIPTTANDNSDNP